MLETSVDWKGGFRPYVYVMLYYILNICSVTQCDGRGGGATLNMLRFQLLDP
jgi:hypothetical protein